MQHYFDVEMAKKYGILESVLFNHFVFWIEKNRGWLLLCGQPGAGKSHLCTAAAGMLGCGDCLICTCDSIFAADCASYVDIHSCLCWCWMLLCNQR